MMWVKGAVMMSSGPELLGARGRATSEGWRINYVSLSTEAPLPPSPRYCDNCSLRCSSIGPRGPVARLCTGRSCAPCHRVSSCIFTLSSHPLVSITSPSINSMNTWTVWTRAWNGGSRRLREVSQSQRRPLLGPSLLLLLAKRAY